MAAWAVLLGCGLPGVGRLALAAGPPRLRWASWPRAPLGCPFPARLRAELGRSACFCLSVFRLFC
jgi:hypothetical protein